MPVSMWLFVNLFCIAILYFLYYFGRRQTNIGSAVQRTLSDLMLMTLVTFAADTLSRFYVSPAALYPAAVAGTYLKYILIPSISLLWFRYVYLQIFPQGDGSRAGRGWWRAMIVFDAVNAAVTLSTGLTGWTFFFDAQHVYHRGPFYQLSMAVMFAMALVAEAFVVFYRKQIDRRLFFALFFFLFPPLIGGVLQAVLYGLPYTLMGVVLSLLIVFVYSQNCNMNLDYLTGAYNRRWLDIHMQEAVDACRDDGRPFAAIMLDLDNFKSINDTHGHAVGDTALQTSVRLLLQCLRSSDCVARYGGDEFCVLLQSVSMQDLESIVDRIRDRLDNFNHSGRAPYLLRFSMGYSVYDPASGWNAEDFTKEIDRRMYEDKRTNHREGIRS